MTPSQASRIAVAMVLSDLKHQQHNLGEPEVDSKRLAKWPRVDFGDPISHVYANQGPTAVATRPRVDPDPISHVYTGLMTVPTTPRVNSEDPISHVYAHQGPTTVPTTPRVNPEDPISHFYAQQGPTTVPTRARTHSTRSQHRNTSTPSTSTNAGPSKPTPAYQKCSNCGTLSLPADNPALERRCKDCGHLFFPCQHETDYAQAHVSPYAPLPVTNLLAFSSLQSGPYLGFSAAPVPTRIRWLFQNDKYWLVNESGQPIDAAGELVDSDYYLIDPITKARRLDLFRRDMHGRAYPEPRTNDRVPVDTDSQTG